MNTTAELTSQDIVEGIGITYRQFDWWIRHHAVWPTDPGRRGTRQHRRWSEADRFRLQAIAQVLDDLSALGIHQTSHALVRRLWIALADTTTYAEVISGTITIRLGLEER